MKTRIISILLAVCLIFGLLPVGVLAASATSGSCGKNATWHYDTATKTLSISGSGDMTDYETDPAMGIENAPPWDDYREEIEHVIINEGITSIGAEAFGFQYTSNCYSNLSSVSIAPTVTKIGSCAFTNAEKLKSIDLPNVTSIGYAAFNGTGIQSLMLPSTLETFEYEDSRWFLCCGNLQSITVDPGNQKYRSVDGVLFAGNKLLRYPAGKAGNIYTVPSGTTWIATSAFADNENITTISIPSSVSKIDSLAFEQCSKLAKITIAEGVTRVASDAFWGTALTSIVLPASVNDFTTNWGTEPDVDYLNRTFYFTGTEAPKFDTFCCNVWSGYKVVICYPENATGWDAVQQQDDVKYQVEAGVLEFKTGTPPTEPSEPTDELKLVSTSPANGSTDVTEDDSLVLTFNQELSKNLNWTKGSIYIKNYNTDETALKIDSAKFYALGGYINGNTLTIPYVFASLPYGGRYYVSVDNGLILSSTAQGFAGILPRAYSFTFLRGYTLGHDNNSFRHYNMTKDSGFYGVKDYYIPNELYIKLTANSSTEVKSKIKKLMASKWGGNCYGIAVTMALVYGGNITCDDISSSSADCYYELPLPYKDTKLLNSITYYQLSQYTGVIPSTSFSGAETYMAIPKLIEVLQSGNIAVLGYGYYDEDGDEVGHAILACSVRQNNDGSYIVQLYDENCSPRNEHFIDMHISSDQKSFSFTDANGYLITNKTSRYVEVSMLDDLYSVKPYSQMRAQSSKSTATIEFPVNSMFTLTDEAGETFCYGNDGNFSGTLNPISVDMFINGEHSTWLVDIPYSSVYSVKFEPDETFDMNVSTTDKFFCVKGTGIQTVEYDFTSGVIINEGLNNRYSFETYVATDTTTNDGETNLVLLTGNAKGKTQIQYNSKNEEIAVTSDAPLENQKAYSLVYSSVYDLPTRSNGDKKFTVSTEIPDRTPSDTSISTHPNYSQNENIVFTDVSKTDYFYDAVLWAVENGITTGTSRTRFSPYATCTRAQAVTFLWRASGSPAPKNSRMPFVDVSPSAYYYDAVLWALEEGITTGTSSTTFSPDAVIDRAQAVTFLHRANGAPSVTGHTAFTDVPQTAYYADAVKWAVDHGITTGTSAAAFSPNASCTRAQIVTFLYRACQG